MPAAAAPLVPGLALLALQAALPAAGAGGAAAVLVGLAAAAVLVGQAQRALHCNNGYNSAVPPCPLPVSLPCWPAVIACVLTPVVAVRPRLRLVRVGALPCPTAVGPRPRAGPRPSAAAAPAAGVAAQGPDVLVVVLLQVEGKALPHALAQALAKAVLQGHGVVVPQERPSALRVADHVLVLGEVERRVGVDVLGVLCTVVKAIGFKYLSFREEIDASGMRRQGECAYLVSSPTR